MTRLETPKIKRHASCLCLCPTAVVHSECSKLNRRTTKNYTGRSWRNGAPANGCTSLLIPHHRGALGMQQAKPQNREKLYRKILKKQCSSQWMQHLQSKILGPGWLDPIFALSGQIESCLDFQGLKGSLAPTDKTGQCFQGKEEPRVWKRHDFYGICLSKVF